MIAFEQEGLLNKSLSFQTVLHTPTASAEGNVGGGQHSLGLAVLTDFCERVDDTTNETNEDSRHTAECDWSIEEYQTTESDGKLVQGSNHGVGGGRCDANSPSRCVGDEDGGKTRDDHDGNDSVALFGGEVLLDVRGGPVFNEDGCDEEDGDSEKVVVVHGCSMSMYDTKIQC
jgi:hypothetical protein